VFTGLVETTGKLEQRAAHGPGFSLTIGCLLGSLELGESIAVNGACLTVARLAAAGFEADVSRETVERTTLGRAELGSELNLERSLRVGDRLGGHLVSGHVDGIARVRTTEPVGEALRVEIEAPEALLPFIAAKGSVTLDGVSRTVNCVSRGAFEIMLIPHTLAVTNLKGVRAGRELNLEVDLLARYVVHYLANSRLPR
jgi:riboflavin synthase